MKVTITEPEVIEKELNLTYPYLGISKSGTVVKFSGKGKGKLFSSKNKKLCVDEYRKSEWTETAFRRLPKGTVLTIEV